MNADTAVYLPDALVINVPEIDEQHAALFAALAHLKDRCVDSNCLPPDDAVSLLESLRVHCATEEELAALAGLEFAAHAAKHQQMLKGIAKTIDEVLDGRMDAFSLIRYLEYWFERHIREEDTGLGRGLQNAALPRESTPLGVAGSSQSSR